VIVTTLAGQGALPLVLWTTAISSRCNVRVARWRPDHLDRAITGQDLRGFIKVVHLPDGEVVGAQIVAARAGEIVHELSLAIDQRIKLGELASSMHVYPTYAIRRSYRPDRLHRGSVIAEARSVQATAAQLH